MEEDARKKMGVRGGSGLDRQRDVIIVTSNYSRRWPFSRLGTESNPACIILIHRILLTDTTSIHKCY